MASIDSFNRRSDILSCELIAGDLSEPISQFNVGLTDRFTRKGRR